MLGGYILKTRIATSIALAAALAFGATGCGLFAPQATTDPYAPSDGIEATFSGLDVRNLLLVQAEDGTHANIVFTAVNSTNDPKQLHISFTSADGATEASADFIVEPGTQPFGDVEGENEPVFVSLPGVVAGSSVSAFLSTPGSPDLERAVPMLDGTLEEYRAYVLPNSMTEPATRKSIELEIEEIDEEAVVVETE